ncbi:hypothetical protein R84B8_00256 [Treponema sp. R8-4-B8]
MKKLIVLSVVFALVATAAFAVDLGGTVIGNVTLVQSDTSDDAEIIGYGSFKRLRFEGYGEAAEGKFGGWLRLGDGQSPGFSGYAFWKPIDQFKLLIGGNPDGMYGKEGTAGWMFYQTPYDTGVTMPGDNTWGGANIYGQGLKFRNAFFRGFGDNGLHLNIKPIDMIGINIALPFISKLETDSDGNPIGAKAEDVFKAVVAQLDLNFDFGNIAITYEGEGSYIANGNNNWAGAGGTIFAYFGGNFGSLGLDFGLGYNLPDDNDQSAPLAVGLALKVGFTDTVGLKVRLAGSFAGQGDNKDTNILADILPYFNLGDNLAVFVSVGLGLKLPDGGGDAVIGWHFNPYIQIGEEWGAKFVAGVQVSSNGGEDAIIKWAVPIAISIGF